MISSCVTQKMKEDSISDVLSFKVAIFHFGLKLTTLSFTVLERSVAELLFLTDNTKSTNMADESARL
jgi:hypothetical protein